MANVHIPHEWQLAESKATPEDAFLNRREFMLKMGLAGLGAASIGLGCFGNQSDAGAGEFSGDIKQTIPPAAPPYPVARNAKYTVDIPLTDELTAASYNNFYEFTTDKGGVWMLARNLETSPWKAEVTGLVHRPRTFDVDELLRLFPPEERVYRFRCVEAWSMVVPWTGFPFQKLIDAVEPSSDAKYFRLLSFKRPEQAAGQSSQSWYRWPYYEGLSLAEASNELTLLATGIYGHALPKQHGAPIRLITPWKYGYKNIKSVVKIEFVKKRPHTFWNDLAPNEYDFRSNVNPYVPHPRWSQASERVVDTGERIPTRIYNGYGQYVDGLY